MVAQSGLPHGALLESRLAERRASLHGRSTWATLTSVPALAAALLGFTLLAMGPLQSVDLALARLWLHRMDPSLVPFAQNVLDRLSSQPVCAPVLAAVAGVLARRRRSWRPLVIAAAAEACFVVGVGALKVFFARGVTYDCDPSFFAAGLLEKGTIGIRFPSGHASESVLLYGAAVYLVARYSGASERAVRALQWGVAAIATVSATTSFVLGWHWMTDLLGGVLVGALFLRLIVEVDTRLRRRADDAAWRGLLSA